MEQVELLDGPVQALYDRCRRGFDDIDAEIHCAAYCGTHEPSFAESEFAGKYLSTCVKFARRGDETSRRHAETVVRAVVRNQRADGYLGGLAPGHEWEAFSVWNQAFTVDGLLAYHELTGDPAARAAAEKCVKNIARHYLDHPAHDILDAPNYGTQHASILIVLPRLERLTGDPVYRTFFDFICARLRASDNNFLDCPDPMRLRSQKGIENFVILLGLADGCADGKTALRRYARWLRDTQIRRTGNGTVAELWTPGGNAPQLLRAEVRPNENCVAVGWMETNLLLFRATKDPAYLDDVERTLYNHLMAAADESGTDFAYYQPNIGHRVTRTAAQQYKCCRYRGFHVVSCLPDALFDTDGDTVIPMLYTPAVYTCGDVRITEQTDYPYGDTVTFRVAGAHIPALRLRIPRWCTRYDVTVRGRAYPATVENGSVTVRGLRDGDTVALCLHTAPDAVDATIDGAPYRSYSYGCVLLARSVTRETELDVPVDAEPPVRTEPTEGRLCFTAGDTRLTDYASAGRRCPTDAYTVWMRVHPRTV